MPKRLRQYPFRIHGHLNITGFPFISLLHFLYLSQKLSLINVNATVIAEFAEVLLPDGVVYFISHTHHLFCKFSIKIRHFQIHLLRSRGLEASTPPPSRPKVNMALHLSEVTIRRLGELAKLPPIHYAIGNRRDEAQNEPRLSTVIFFAIWRSADDLLSDCIAATLNHDRAGCGRINLHTLHVVVHRQLCRSAAY